MVGSAAVRCATKGGPGGPDPYPFFKSIKVPFFWKSLEQFIAFLLNLSNYNHQ